MKGARIDDTIYGSILLEVNKISNEIPTGYKIEQNYPNPFNSSTVIKFSLPKSSNVKLKIFDRLGREVTTLVDEKKSAGSYQYVFNGNNLSSGIYFYRIQSQNFVETRKMILLK